MQWLFRLLLRPSLPSSATLAATHATSNFSAVPPAKDSPSSASKQPLFKLKDGKKPSLDLFHFLVFEVSLVMIVVNLIKMNAYIFFNRIWRLLKL